MRVAGAPQQTQAGAGATSGDKLASGVHNFKLAVLTAGVFGCIIMYVPVQLNSPIPAFAHCQFAAGNLRFRGHRAVTIGWLR